MEYNNQDPQDSSVYLTENQIHAFFALEDVRDFYARFLDIAEIRVLQEEGNAEVSDDAPEISSDHAEKSKSEKEQKNSDLPEPAVILRVFRHEKSVLEVYPSRDVGLEVLRDMILAMQAYTYYSDEIYGQYTPAYTDIFFADIQEKSHLYLEKACEYIEQIEKKREKELKNEDLQVNARNLAEELVKPPCNAHLVLAKNFSKHCSISPIYN